MKIKYQIGSLFLKRVIAALDFFGYSLEKILKRNQDMDHKFREDLKDLKIKKVLLLKPEGIGDLLCATPAISLIKRNLPDSRITILCSSSTAPLVKFNPRVDRLCPLDFFWMRQKPSRINLKTVWEIFESAWQLRKEHFDLIIDFRGDPRNILFISLLGGKYRLSYVNQGLGFLLTNKLLESNKKQHIVDRNLHLLKKFFPGAGKPKLELFIDKKSKKKSQKILPENNLSPKERIISVHLGSTSSKKAWEIENFIELIKNLVSAYSHKIALIGTKGDQKSTKAILNSLKSPKIIDLTGKLKLLEVARVIKQSALAITCDSGITHMAVAVGTPVIDLIGPSDPLVWGPYGGEKLVIHKSLPCNPCIFKVYSHKCLYNEYRCMDLITVEDVFKKVRKVIK